MSIKLRAWDHWNDEMIYSDKFDDLYGFFYSVKRREDGGNKVTLMLQSKCEDHDNNPIYEGDIIRFHYGAGDEIKTGIVECRPEHFCYWQVKVPGDNFGLERVIGCYSSAYVTGNRYADREWLEDEGLVGLLEIGPEKENEAAEFVEAIKGRVKKTKNLFDRIRGIKPAAPDPKNEEPCADEPGVPISRVEALRIAGETLEKAEEERIVKPARIESDYRDDFGQTIREADILVFSLCGRRITGEVKHIWSDDRYYWQVWTYESPKLKLSLRHICEDVACSEVRVIGHISTVRQGGVAVQDIGIQL